MSQLHRALLASETRQALLLGLVVFLAYANSIDNGFHYDDKHSIVENPHIRSLGNVPSFFVDPTYFSRDPEFAMYRPMLLTTFALNYAIAGEDVRLYHLGNMLLHAACTLLVWQILKAIGRKPSAALVGALLFGLHPACTEPVNYVSSRSEILASMFLLASFLLYLRSDQLAGDGARARRLLMASVALFLFSLLSKSIGITLLGLLVAWNLIERRPLTALVRSITPYAAVAAGYLAFISGFIAKAVFSEPVRSGTEQLGTQAKALVYYAKLMFFPRGLSVHHQFFESAWSPAVFAALLALLSVAVLLVQGHRRARGALLGCSWMAITISPTVVVPLYIAVNDHRMYLPLVGHAVLLTAYTGWIRQNGMGLAAIAIGILGATVATRNGVWADDYTLWSDVARKSPTPFVPVAYIHLGNYAKEHGALAEAVAYFEQAVAIAPDHVAARNNMANVFQQMGRLEEARRLYQALLREHPDLAEAHYNLARVHQMEEEFGLAIGHYRAVSADSPHYDVALNNLGTVYEKSARLDSAVFFYRSALEESPFSQDARQNLERVSGQWGAVGQRLMQQGRVAETESASRQLLAANPSHRQARFLLGVSLFLQGRYRDSIAENRRLVADHPDFAEGYLQLANAYETTGRLPEAMATYREQLSRSLDPSLAADARDRLQRLVQRGEP